MAFIPTSVSRVYAHTIRLGDYAYPAELYPFEWISCVVCVVGGVIAMLVAREGSGADLLTGIFWLAGGIFCGIALSLIIPQMRGTRPGSYLWEIKLRFGFLAKRQGIYSAHREGPLEGFRAVGALSGIHLPRPHPYRTGATRAGMDLGLSSKEIRDARPLAPRYDGWSATRTMKSNRASGFPDHFIIKFPCGPFEDQAS